MAHDVVCRGFEGKGPNLVLAQVATEDSIALQKTKEFINLRQWAKASKERWGFSKKEAKRHWQEMLGDDRVVKSKDQMNWLTMPALHIFSWDPQVYLSLLCEHQLR